MKGAHKDIKIIDRADNHKLLVDTGVSQTEKKQFTAWYFVNTTWLYTAHDRQFTGTLKFY